jgi:hypothetical protein
VTPLLPDPHSSRAVFVVLSSSSIEAWSTKLVADSFSVCDRRSQQPSPFTGRQTTTLDGYQPSH